MNGDGMSETVWKEPHATTLRMRLKVTWAVLYIYLRQIATSLSILWSRGAEVSFMKPGARKGMRIRNGDRERVFTIEDTTEDPPLPPPPEPT